MLVIKLDNGSVYPAETCVWRTTDDANGGYKITHLTIGSPTIATNAAPTVVGATGTNGFREQIIPSGEKQCGIHINPHKPEDIYWGIEQILKLDDKGLRMGKNARERVIEIFSWERVAKRTIDIYTEFIRDKK